MGSRPSASTEGGDEPERVDAAGADADIPVVEVDGRVAMAGHEAALVAEPEPVGGAGDAEPAGLVADERFRTRGAGDGRAVDAVARQQVAGPAGLARGMRDRLAALLIARGGRNRARPSPAVRALCGRSALNLPFPARRAAPGKSVVVTRRPTGGHNIMPHQVANHAAGVEHPE